MPKVRSLILAAVMALPSTATAQTLDMGTGSPDIYVIQRGDTLWDVASRFLGSSDYWPQLWSLNTYITNPHWIYPGNRIVFRPGTLLDPPSVGLEDVATQGYLVPTLSYEPVEMECGPDVRFDDSVATGHYVTTGVVASEADIDVLGTVYAAKTGRRALGEGDLLYLDIKDLDTVDCGDVFSLVRKTGKAPSSQSRSTAGSVYRVVAEVRVLHKTEEMATAEVRRSFWHAKRGDEVVARIPVDAQLPVRPPQGDLEGTILGRVSETALMATQETVFVDVGRSDGLRVGDTFWVVHRRDEVASMSDDDPRIPEQVVGRVLITQVGEDVSTGVVVDAARQLNVGDALQMRLESDEM